MPLIAVTDLFPYWQSLLDSLVKIIAIVGVPYIAYRMQQQSVEAEKVKQELKSSGIKTDAQYHVIHDFLNHEKRVLLSDKAILARERYETSKREDHKLIAELAEKVLRDHDEGQKKVDEKAKLLASPLPKTSDAAQIVVMGPDEKVLVVPTPDKK